MGNLSSHMAVQPWTTPNGKRIQRPFDKWWLSRLVCQRIITINHGWRKLGWSGESVVMCGSWLTNNPSPSCFLPWRVQDEQSPTAMWTHVNRWYPKLWVKNNPPLPLAPTACGPLGHPRHWARKSLRCRLRARGRQRTCAKRAMEVRSCQASSAFVEKILSNSSNYPTKAKSNTFEYFAKPYLTILHQWIITANSIYLTC